MYLLYWYKMLSQLSAQLLYGNRCAGQLTLILICWFFHLFSFFLLLLSLSWVQILIIIYIHNKKIKLLIFTFTLQFRIKRSWGKSNVWSTFSLAICKKCRTLGRPLINSCLDRAVRKVTLESIVRELNAWNNICLIIFVPVTIENVSLTFIDKSDPSDQLKREENWRSMLKTMAQFGLNIEESM